MPFNTALISWNIVNTLGFNKVRKGVCSLLRLKKPSGASGVSCIQGPRNEWLVEPNTCLPRTEQERLHEQAHVHYVSKKWGQSGNMYLMSSLFLLFLGKKSNKDPVCINELLVICWKKWELIPDEEDCCFSRKTLDKPHFLDEDENQRLLEERQRELAEYKEFRQQVEAWRAQDQAFRNYLKLRQLEDAQHLQVPHFF